MNKKGAALMQVLLITLILAGIATMLLRASLSRTVSARKTRRTVTAQLLMERCMAEVNALWTAKTPEAYNRDWTNGNMYCSGNNGTSCSTTYTCSIPNPYNASSPYTVIATFAKASHTITYTIGSGNDAL